MIKLFIITITLLSLCSIQQASAQDKKRPRELGVHVGILKPGANNAITDVSGVKVGHTTLIRGEDVRTGVTVIMPHEGNVFREKVPAAVYVGNGYGKAMGFTQIDELGEIETPIALTNTLNTPLVANALLDYVLALEGNENVRSVNAIVGETNDGYLNDIRARNVAAEHVLEAIRKASGGKVEEGNVGAGTGTRALGFKGGIGTSSRVLPKDRGGYTVGVLVQSNFGGILTINGAPVGRELNNFYMANDIPYDVDGSCMIVIATDAPLSARNLKRLAKRTFLAFGRVGAFSSNGSGDYTIAFSTAESVRRNGQSQDNIRTVEEVKNSRMSPLFLAAVEATEEALYNSLFMANDVTGYRGRTTKALPVGETLEILKKYNALNWDEKLLPWSKKK